MRLLAIPQPWLHAARVYRCATGTIRSQAQFRRALQMTLGDPLVFFRNPGSATLLSLATIALLAPFAKALSRLMTAEDREI